MKHKQIVKSKAAKGFDTKVLVISEVVVGLVASLFSALVFYKVTDKVVDNETSFIDNFFVQLFYNLRTQELTDIMKFFSFVGMDIIIILSIIIPLFLFVKKRFRDSILFTTMISLGMVINYSLKLLIQRERPIGFALIEEPTFSFPSGHSMNSFIFFVTIAYFVYKYSKNRVLTILVFLTSGMFIFMIGISRVYLGVHYPSDILGGYIAGFLWIASFYFIDKSLTMIRLVSKD